MPGTSDVKNFLAGATQEEVALHSSGAAAVHIRIKFAEHGLREQGSWFAGIQFMVKTTHLSSGSEGSKKARRAPEMRALWAASSTPEIWSMNATPIGTPEPGPQMQDYLAQSLNISPQQDTGNNTVTGHRPWPQIWGPDPGPNIQASGPQPRHRTQ